MSERDRVLLIATHNLGKVAELHQLLGPSGWQICALDSESPSYEETGTTFGANARGKAGFYSAMCHGPALADDSGLQIDALDGEPGVLSARYVDPDITQAKRNEAVLEKLKGVPKPARTARFVCHLALAVAGQIVHQERGECGGRIVRTPRGTGGFGYDPIFLRPELGRTFAELSSHEKSALSHRGQAVRRMVEFLRAWDPPPAR